MERTLAEHAPRACTGAGQWAGRIPALSEIHIHKEQCPHCAGTRPNSGHRRFRTFKEHCPALSRGPPRRRTPRLNPPAEAPYLTLPASMHGTRPPGRPRARPGRPGAAVAQSVEHLICNQGVGGSIPSCGTNSSIKPVIYRDFSSARRTAKRTGAGTNVTAARRPSAREQAAERQRRLRECKRLGVQAERAERQALGTREGDYRDPDPAIAESRPFVDDFTKTEAKWATLLRGALCALRRFVAVERTSDSPTRLEARSDRAQPRIEPLSSR